MGLYLNGRTLNDVNAFGEPIVDDTFLMLLNPGHDSLPFHLPDPRPGFAWEAIVDTRHQLDVDPVIMPLGASYDLSARCSVLLREVILLAEEQPSGASQKTEKTVQASLDGESTEVSRAVLSR